ncbi:MAG: hypothetical protein NTV81_03355 [Candidatus Komeilibacteria bacterium]|nr:hypothetical protein [Candidatus Komeilibacteria bacterium]
MPQDVIQQIKNLIIQSKKILIAASTESGEGLSLALALKTLGAHLSKPMDLVIATHDKQKKFDFLPGFTEILPEVKHIKKCLLEVDLKNIGLQELSYDVTSDKLTIFITPKQGFVETKDVAVKNSEFAYDAIIVLTTTSLEDLGELYQSHRDMFQKIPVVNIDHQSANDRFGHINWVDITLGSSTQQILDLFAAFPEVPQSPDLATTLLTALIAGTKNFQTTGNQSSSLELASQLMKQGADRELIIKKLYQTKTLANLKLWGRALARLQDQANHQIIWSYLTKEDFLETQADHISTFELMEELFLTNPKAELLTLFIEKAASETLVFCQTKNNYPLTNVAKPYNPIGNKYIVTFSLPKALLAAQQEILPKLEQALI